MVISKGSVRRGSPTQDRTGRGQFDTDVENECKTGRAPRVDVVPRPGAQTLLMSARHPLDRPAWGALTGPQARWAIGGDLARRFDPAVGPFAAMVDDSPESLAALGELVTTTGSVVLLQAEDSPEPPGTQAVFRAGAWQMMAAETPPPDLGDIRPLAPEDGPEMLALALLTRPGPFAERTHEFGGFFGVRREGRLAAMAGERMRPPDFTEISGVCTHPDHRGQGHGARLTRLVASRIQARGETAFLHVMADNTGALALYEAIGFTRRRPMRVTALAPLAG
jgi:predicted GNAT family acetyltransferase